ncbi:MAG: hypothetical protein NZ926_01180 [Candidatus Methanomethylicia archaeon]|nr:hypothetical protein [Candidatus Methanomethylicia archaeon]MCX8169043.1 hypothetical protein [Candidatus Methanomethylicia archaeon]MDW7988775.1 RNase P subunit p30 family protein [Nitrososphaerota archaeon]
MGRRFIDLHVFSNLSHGTSSISEIIKIASVLGFYAIGIADFNRNNIDIIKDIRKLFEENGLDMVSRVDLHHTDIEHLKRDLRYFRGKVEIIAVFCENLQVARFAARDRRVDILNFSFYDWKKNFFDVSEAKLALENNAALEINVAELLRCSTVGERIKMLKIMSENVKLALKYNLPVIFSSGAMNIFEMREPRALASVATLLGASEFDALRFVSDIPFKLIMENREKLSGKYIYPGVKFLGRVNDKHEIKKE